jgi:hypothetical protein
MTLGLNLNKGTRTNNGMMNKKERVYYCAIGMVVVLVILSFFGTDEMIGGAISLLFAMTFFKTEIFNAMEKIGL